MFMYLTHESYKMVDNNIILLLRTHVILLSSFVIYFSCICHSAHLGIFPIIHSASTYVRCLSKVLISTHSEYLNNTVKMGAHMCITIEKKKIKYLQFHTHYTTNKQQNNDIHSSLVPNNLSQSTIAIDCSCCTMQSC